MPVSQTNTLKIYNSLSGKKEVFTPITPGYVGMYVDQLYTLKYTLEIAGPLCLLT
jgi:hypothetical protein